MVTRPVVADTAFHEALRAAIATSGLSLDRIEDRLRRHGCRVSVATLSSWQSGRNRPERPRSLAALAVLEEVVHLPPGALAALLGPPKPRGRRLHSDSGRYELAAVWSDRSDIDRALCGVDDRWDQALTRISCHRRVELDEQGRERSMWCRQLLRAECDGPDRCIIVYRLAVPGPLPQVHTSAPSRTGRVVEVPDDRLLVAEVLFDRPLARGETVIVEYTLDHLPPLSYSTRAGCILHLPVREYVLEVRFDPAALPSSCWSFRSSGLGSPAQERLLRPDSIGSVHAVALAVQPCRFGIRWTWD
jgi:hypothetical protein